MRNNKKKTMKKKILSQLNCKRLASYKHIFRNMDTHTHALACLLVTYEVIFIEISMTFSLKHAFVIIIVKMEARTMIIMTMVT